MKKVAALLAAVALFFSLASAAMADNAVDKLGRGVANVITCPFEIFKGMGDAKEEGGIFAGLTTGLFMGTVNTVKRAAVGVFEVATFPVPLPAGYKPILDEPEYFLEKEKY